MKNSLYLILLIALFTFSCSEDNDDNLVSENNDNNVALLKVDFLTHTFEGGQELTFESTTDFNIVSNYQAPGDFGSIELVYNELEQPLFKGTIIWMGLGERSLPESLQGIDNFETLSEPVEMPSVSMFANVMYDEFAFYPEDLDYSLLWDSIKNLKIVQQYRQYNPNETIKIFLYTPSVGIGNPEEWDYYIILKN